MKSMCFNEKNTVKLYLLTLSGSTMESWLQKQIYRFFKIMYSLSYIVGVKANEIIGRMKGKSSDCKMEVVF